MLEEADLKEQYEAKNPIIKYYVWGRLKKAVELADLVGNEKILDFGCFNQSLKNVLPETCNYIGYDINPEFTDLKDYTKIKGIDTIFALNVIEHLTESELIQTMKNFKKLQARQVIIELPQKDTLVNKTLNTVLGYNFHDAVEHKVVWRQAVKIIDRYFDCIKYHNNFWITWISKWGYAPKNKSEEVLLRLIRAKRKGLDKLF